MKKLTPKIHLKFKDKNGQMVTMYPTVRKMRKWLKARHELKNKSLPTVSFKVVYGKATTCKGKKEIFDNEIISENLSDIEWALDAFMEEDLFVAGH